MSKPLQLNIHDRFMALQLMQTREQGNLADWKIVQEAMELLSFKPAEFDSLGIKISEDGKTVSWKEEIAKELSSYEFSDRAYAILKEVLSDIDLKNAITKDTLPLALLVLEKDGAIDVPVTPTVEETPAA